jgi:hypothetical protein
MIQSPSQINTYSIARFAIALPIAILIDFSRRLIEPAHGIFDIIFSAIFSVLHGTAAIALIAISGLLFFIPPVKRLWFGNKLPFWITIFAGLTLLLYGILTAHHVYFDLHKTGEAADFYLARFAWPGYFLFLFSFCYCPFIFKSKV